MSDSGEDDRVKGYERHETGEGGYVLSACKLLRC